MEHRIKNLVGHKMKMKMSDYTNFMTVKENDDQQKV